MLKTSITSNAPNWVDRIADKYSKLDFKRHKLTKTVYDPRLLITKQSSYLNFVSNDYLGFAKHPALLDSVNNIAQQFGVGSTGAGTLSGYTSLHQQLTTTIADWLGFEQCLLFPTGYQLNTSIYSALVDKNTTIWFDRYCHASHIDGVLLSKGKFVSFVPESFAEVGAKINQQQDRLHILITEGIFSMDGTCTYLQQLQQLKLANKNNLLVVVDDAHGLGSIGTNGKGTLSHVEYDLQFVDILIGTFSKAFASSGGFLLANKIIANYLEQTVRSQLFTTSIAPVIIGASIASLALICSDYGRNQRNKLLTNIRYCQQLALANKLTIHNYQTNLSPVQLIMLNDENQTRAVGEALMQKGIFVGKICYPTVSKNTARLRISINAEHLFTDIEYLIKTLSTVLRYEVN